MAAGALLSDLEVVSSPIEHPSVLDVLEYWREQGLTVRYVAPDEYGRITPRALTAVLTRKTALVTLAYANSEIGVVQPVRKLARAIRSFTETSGTMIAFHIDASQAPLWLPCQLPHLGADLMTLDAGKCHGPKGVGLLVRHGDGALMPVLFGGGQEGGLRSGTENVPSIAAAAVALVDAQRHHEARGRRILPIAQALATALTEKLPGAVLNGPPFSSYESLQRLPHNVHISIPGLDTEYAVVVLDTHGVAAGTRSACSGKGSGESVVIREISGDPDRARSTIRFTLDPTVSPRVVPAVTRILMAHHAQMRTVDPTAL
jgi:cysteine desulfurase